MSSKVWHLLSSCTNSCHPSYSQQLCSTWDQSELCACELLLLPFLFTFAFEREGVSWSKGREVDRLERQTSQCLPTCKWPLCLFSWGLDNSQSITVAGSFFPQHMWGQYVEVCVWYMTNEMVLNSGDAGKAWLNEVQPVWLRVTGGMGVPCSCQVPSLNHHVGGATFTDMYVIEMWHKICKI